jgi:hypothetical protein
MPTHFHYIIYITNQVVVYAPAEREDTLLICLLYPCVYSVVCMLERYLFC